MTPEKRRQAAADVREGISVSLVRDAETEATIDGSRTCQVTASGSPPTRSGTPAMGSYTYPPPLTPTFALWDHCREVSPMKGPRV